MCWSPICSAPPTASTHRAGSAVRRVGIWIASCLCRQGAGDQGWISYNCCCLIAAHCLDHLPKRYFWWSKSRLQRTREAWPIKPEVAPLLKVAQSGIWFSFWKPFIWFPSCWCTIHTSLQDWELERGVIKSGHTVEASTDVWEIFGKWEKSVEKKLMLKPNRDFPLWWWWWWWGFSNHHHHEIEDDAEEKTAHNFFENPKLNNFYHFFWN